jgi:hypothetical protein
MALRGFYPEAVDRGSSFKTFVTQLKLTWIYCPDEVTHLGHKFLDSVNKESAPGANPMGDFVAAIRRDLLSQVLVTSSDLSGKEFRHYAVKG